MYILVVKIDLTQILGIAFIKSKIYTYNKILSFTGIYKKCTKT